LLAAAPDGPPSSQGLLMPETVRVPPRAAAVLRQNVGLLRDMGFGVSEFGGDTFIVDAVPAAVAGLAVADLLAELAADGESESLGRAGARWSRESIARAASRHAAGPRDRLRMDELERLVSELAACEMPYTCPHGRPTLVFMGRSEIRRKFGRS
jgi:DNA mismatch repair protein MutL